MRTRRSFSIILVFLFVSITVSLVACQAQVDSGTARSLAPDFTLRDLNGESFRLSDMKGKVVILDFWATWCPPCRAELPHFQALHREYAGKGLVIVGISLDSVGAAGVKAFIEANGVRYPILMGDRDVTTSYGGIRSIPTTFVIDREGRIVKKLVGYQSKEVFEGLVRELL